MPAKTDYQKIAGDLLFGGETLDNAMRGIFIEAVVSHALLQHDAQLGVPSRWRHVGLGWGPWDLQRGTHGNSDRVRVQVKVKAARQLWTPAKVRPFTFDLGLRAKQSTPRYFARDYPTPIYGECEPNGYRCDLFLLVWHGPDPRLDSPVHPEDQSNPQNYWYFVVPTARFYASATLPKTVNVNELFGVFGPPCLFDNLPRTLNSAADNFLRDSSK